MTTPRRWWKDLTPLTRRLVVFTAINAVVVDVLLMGVFLTPWSLTALGHTGDFLVAEQGEDSWGPMGRAWAHVGGAEPTPVYDAIFFEQQYKFQYPPTTLLPYYTLEPLAARLGAPVLAPLNALAWLSVVVALASSVWLFLRSARLAGIDRDRTVPTPEQALRIACVIVLGLTFYPLIRAYTQGQIQAWINAAFALALVAWVAGLRLSSGALLGFVTLIKPQYGLFVVWGALRRQWGFVASFAVTCVVGLAVSVALFGWANHVNYLDVIRFLGERGESYYANQSVNGLMHRLLFNGYNLGWKGRAFPPFHAVVYAATVLTSLAFIVIGLAWRRGRPARADAIDFCVMGLTCTLASPVAWEHHYGILLPVFAWVVPLVRARHGSVPVSLVAGYVLCSNFIAASAALAPIPVLNVGQSYLFFGALGLWILLVLERGQSRAARRA